MSNPPKANDDPDKLWKYIIAAFVSITHIIAFFQIVICSRHMAVAFDIPAKNIGIYFAKLYSLRSLLMSAGCAIEYVIFRAIQISTGSADKAKEIRRYLSMTWFCLLTICEVSFLMVLYFSKRVAFHNYIVLNLEGLFFGFFQMSILSLIPEFVPYYMLSLYVSGTCIFIIQTLIDKCTKNSMLSVKTQSWICVLCSVICIGIWPVRLFMLEGTSHTQTQSPSLTSSSSGAESSAPGGGSVSHVQIKYLMSMTSLSILKLITNELNCLCSQLHSVSLINVQILSAKLQQITCEREITDEVLVSVDLIILALKCSCSPGQLSLLTQLSLFLRIKTVVKTCSRPEPAKTDTARPAAAAKPEATKTGCKTGKDFFQQLLESLSQLMMFPIGSLVKDFLFPGVIPYGLLERDKCHLINLIVIIFLSIGPLTIFIMQQTIGDDFKCDNTFIHLCWSCMIPKILILIISLCAIHTKQSSTHQIRSSRWRVFLMTMILLTCYGFLETMSFVGMGHYVHFIGGKKYLDLLAIHNVCGKFFRYFVYKVSVGYNKTRIGAGLVLPKFEPPEPIPDTLGFWFTGAFSNGWKDIKGDFKMGIQQYLAVEQTVSKKSPLETLRYCDLLM